MISAISVRITPTLLFNIPPSVRKTMGLGDAEWMGRKRVLLIGLMGTCLSCIGFGFSRSFGGALCEHNNLLLLCNDLCNQRPHYSHIAIQYPAQCPKECATLP
jgi:hypothetical protein